MLRGNRSKKNSTTRSLLLLCSLVICLGVLAGGRTAQAEQKTFTMGFDAEFPPYGYMDDNGEYVGFDLSLAEEVCKRRDWKLVKRPIYWDSKDQELNSGSIDCIWNGFTMNGREKEYTWTTPYVDNSQVVIVRADSDIQKLTDLKGKVVAVQADSSALAALTGEDATAENKKLAASFKKLQEVADYNSAFMSLESGSMDAICMDIGVASYQVSSAEESFRMLDEQISTEAYGIGFKKGNTKLRDQVQVTLLEMLYDGTYEKIAKEWKLSDSICLSKEDREYIDGGAVPKVKFQMIAAEKNKADDSSEDVVVAKKTGKMTVGEIAKQLTNGMAATLGIFVLTLLFSMPLGLVITSIRMSRFKILQWIARIYISVMRGTPLMLQLLVVYFAPYYVFKIDLSYSYRFYAVIIGFTLNYAAYFAEIYRGGIQSIPGGQREAAAVLGYNKMQTFFKIIFPQMVKRVLPPVTNEIITLVKDTSLAFALSYTEMFTLAKQISAAQKNLIALFVAGVFYYIFNFIVAYVMERAEKKLDYYQ